MEPTEIPTIARIRGWLLIVVGACLGTGMAALAAFMASTIARGDRPGGTHWTGSHNMTIRVFELFATIFVFGLVSVAGGIFQLRSGRASWLAMFGMFALIAVMYFLGQSVMQMQH